MQDLDAPLLALSPPGDATAVAALAPALPRHERRSLDAAAGGGAARIAAALLTVERLIEDASPASLLLCGEGPEVTAAALVAVKLGLPQARLGAGARSGERHEPAEADRAIADRLCDLLLCADDAARANLEREGLAGKARVVGDAAADPDPTATEIRAWLETASQ